MCCFSGVIERVSATSIFARKWADQQLLVYSMTLDTRTEVAMILPLPIAPSTGGVRFLDLEHYPELFSDLARCFPVPLSRGAYQAFGAPQPAAYLPVQKVGAFEATFVPSVSDFGRLDPRFILDPSVWKQLPGYTDYGFAVFQLAAGKAEIHPMALAFASRDPSRLFFPTVHVHDRTVPRRAAFDHSLYAQAEGAAPRDWTTGSVLPENVMKLDRLATPLGSLIEPTAPVLRREIRETRTNEDIWLSLG
jgi:hypothetical protein